MDRQLRPDDYGRQRPLPLVAIIYHNGAPVAYVVDHDQQTATPDPYGGTVVPAAICTIHDASSP